MNSMDVQNSVDGWQGDPLEDARKAVSMMGKDDVVALLADVAQRLAEL